MSTFEYTTNCGQFVLTDRGHPISAPMDVVSIGFDRRTGAMHRHGSQETVEAWFHKTQKDLKRAGLDAWADNLMVMTGRFPVEEINRAISLSDYAGRLYRKIQSGEVTETPIADMVKPPKEKN